MNPDRYRELMKQGSKEELTPEEIRAGYHFCYEFDGLLIGPDMHEFELCSCFGFVDKAK